MTDSTDIAEKSKSESTVGYKLGDVELETLTQFTHGPFNFLFYGESGVGKTTLAGTAAQCPNMSPAIYLDTGDGGPQSIAHLGDAVAYSRVNSYPGLLKALSLLESQDHPFKTLILDTLTGAQKLIENDLTKGTEVKFTFEEFRVLLKRTLDVTMALCDLDMHVVCTAHVAKRKENPAVEQSPEKTMPYFQGQAVSRVAHYFDMVGHMFSDDLRVQDPANPGKYVVKSTRELVTSHSKLLQAKNRLPDLPYPFDNPTFPKIWEAIKQNKRSYAA